MNFYPRSLGGVPDMAFNPIFACELDPAGHCNVSLSKIVST